MNPRTKRACLYCGARDAWDRVRYLDECGEVTTYPAAKAYVESVVCLSCKEPQPLGPARDTGPHAAQIAVEVRAAELAQHYAEHENLVEFASAEEMGGWFMRYLDQEYRPRKNAEARYAKSLAGYLAFEIAHGHEPDTRTTKDPQ